jgi:histidinol-phosphatase
MRAGNRDRAEGRPRPPARTADLDLAIGIGREAGRYAADAFGTVAYEVSYKPDGSPVTTADLVAEDLLRERLAQEVPDDEVIGEERPPRVGTSGRRWVLDPIGGTADFVHRVPLFTVDIALEDTHGPAVAVTVLPASGLTMAAGRGLGCWIVSAERQRAQVSDRAELKDAVVCSHGVNRWPDELLLAVRQQCVLRDSVHSLLRLITGRADAILVSGVALGYEDLAGLPVLVEEAGGKVTDISGGPVLSGDGTVLATNGRLHEGFLELLDREW